MPCTVGAGCCIYSIDSVVTPQQCSMLENLLGKCSLVEKIPEYLMDSLGSLVGCGPAYVSLINLNQPRLVIIMQTILL